MPEAIIQDDDRAYRELKVNVATLKDRSIKIGFWGDESTEGTSITDYAMYNEFGTSRGIPPRPFMATTFDRNQNQVSKFVEFLAGQIVDGTNTVERVLNVLGAHYQTLVQRTIREAVSWAIPNAPSTIAQKGSSSPLIDTGRMVGAVRYEVE